MRSPTNDSQKAMMLNNYPKKDASRSREPYYNETRENAYNRQKDLHKDIEIDVPELVDREETHPGGWEKDDDDVNERSNVSAHILQEYKLGQPPSPSKNMMMDARARREVQHTSTTSKMTQNVRSVERQIEDFYKWQDRIKKKHEMQREFQEQVKDSMHDQKIFTNEMSNQLVEAKRPNAKIEDLLLSHGKAKEIKIKKLEEALYSNLGVPNITKRGKKVRREQKVHTRLYDLDKSRRDQSRDSLNRNLSRSTELQRSKSKEFSKRKSLYTLLKGSKTQELRDLDFLSSPRDAFSPASSVRRSTRQPSKDNIYSPQTMLASTSLTAYGSPLHSLRNVNARGGGGNKEHSALSLQTSPVHDWRDSQGKQPISIYKRLTPFSTALNLQLGTQGQAQAFTASQKGGNYPQEEQQDVRYQSPDPQKGKGESNAVLPNMMYFKSAERPVSSTPNSLHQRDSRPQRQQGGAGADPFAPFDMKSMEAFWEKILQDDLEHKGKKHNGYYSQNGYEEDSHRDDLDFTERNRVWLNKKNKKIDDQRKLKEQKEMVGCTFKPQLYGQDKLNQKNSQHLYQNFLQRMALSSGGSPNVTGGEGYINTKKAHYSTMGDLDVLNMMSSGTDGSPKNGTYPEDHDLQKKLYSYILNSKN